MVVDLAVVNFFDVKTSLFGAIVLFLCNVGGSHILLWATLFKPVKGFLFRREAFLLEFQHSLRLEESHKKLTTTAKLAKIDDTVKMSR